jgi:ABC-type transporter Mla subunit MlaD
MDEQLLQKLIDDLIFRFTGESGSSLDDVVAELRNIQSDLKEGRKDVGTATQDVAATTTKIKKAGEEFDNNTSAAKNLTGGFQNLRQGAEKAEGGMKQLGGLLNQTGENFGFLGEVLSHVTGKMVLLGAAVAGTIAVVDQTISNFRSLSEVGQTFTGGLTDMYNTAFESSMTLDQFTESVKASSGAVSALGLRRFGELSKEVRTLAQEFGSFGMTTSQLNEYMGEYIDIQRMAGTLDQMRRNQMASEVTNFIRNIDAVAAATGEARESIMKQVKEDITDPFAAITLANMDDNLRQEFQGAMAQVSGVFGSGAADMLRASFSEFGIYSSEFAEQLAEAGPAGQRFIQEFSDLTGRIQQGEPGAEATLDMIESMQNDSEELRSLILNLRQSGMDTVADQFQRLQKVNVEEMRESLRRQQRLEPFMQMLANLEKHFQDIIGATGTLVTAFLDGLFPRLEHTGKEITDWTEKFVKNIKALRDDFKAVGAFLNEWGSEIAILTGAVVGLYGVIKTARLTMLALNTTVGTVKGTMKFLKDPKSWTNILKPKKWREQQQTTQGVGKTRMHTDKMFVHAKMVNVRGRGAGGGAGGAGGGAVIPGGEGDRDGGRGGRGGGIKNLLKGLSRVGPFAAILSAMQLAPALLNSDLSLDEKTGAVARTGGGLAGSLAMGKAGAALGAMVGGPAGAAIGGLLGAGAGYFAGEATMDLIIDEFRGVGDKITNFLGFGQTEEEKQHQEMKETMREQLQQMAQETSGLNRQDRRMINEMMQAEAGEQSLGQLQRLEEKLSERFGEDATENQQKLLEKMDKMIERLEQGNQTSERTANAMESTAKTAEKQHNRATDESGRIINGGPMSNSMVY